MGHPKLHAYREKEKETASSCMEIGNEWESDRSNEVKIQDFYYQVNVQNGNLEQSFDHIYVFSVLFSFFFPSCVCFSFFFFIP